MDVMLYPSRMVVVLITGMSELTSQVSVSFFSRDFQVRASDLKVCYFLLTYTIIVVIFSWRDTKYMNSPKVSCSFLSARKIESRFLEGDPSQCLFMAF